MTLLKRIFVVFSLAALLTVFSIPYQSTPAQAQFSCTYDCYVATAFFVKKANGTNFNGYAKIYNGAAFSPQNVTVQFIDGLGYYNGDVFVLSGQQAYTWFNIGLVFKNLSDVQTGTGIITARHSTVPTIPNITNVTLDY